MAMYREDLGRNVAAILVQGVRVIRGRIPREVRTELMSAVKLKALGHLKRDGLKPEVFYSPNHPHPYAAADRQREEAVAAAGRVASVMVSGNDLMDERLSYGVRCNECGEWETACRCDHQPPTGKP